MSATRAIRAVTITAVLAVAVVAGWVSYRHAVTVVSAHGESGWVGRVYPATVDGLIVAASMVLLDAARHRDRAPGLAVWLLAAGITATLAANILAGAGYGTLGAVVSAWPALAFVGCYELLMLLVRASARRATTAPVEQPESAAATAPGERSRPAPASTSAAAPAAAPEAHPGNAPESTRRALPARTRARPGSAPGKRTQAAPVTAEDAEREFAAVLASGAVPSIREIRSALHVGQDRGRQIRDHLATLATASQ
jgi:hypothetical protein